MRPKTAYSLSDVLLANLISIFISLQLPGSSVALDRQGSLRRGKSSALEEEVGGESVIHELRPLWPFTAVVLTARELESSGRIKNIKKQLESLSVPFRVVDGDYANRYSSLQEQFEELQLQASDRSAWIGGRAQNDLLKEDLIGNADVFCDVASCMQQPKCICVKDPEALPADSLLSIATTHRRAWQSIADDPKCADSEWHLLVEDDAEFLPNISTAYFGDFQVPLDADLVWLYRGKYQHRCWQSKGEENLLMSGPVFDASDYNAVAYAVTKAGARRLLQHVERSGSPLDIAMSQAVANCGLMAFCPAAGRYPVTDSSFQNRTTRQALSKENFEFDDKPPFAPSFLQLTATGSNIRAPPPSAIAPPRRRVKCSQVHSTD
jgi:hypothetical protein